MNWLIRGNDADVIKALAANPHIDPGTLERFSTDWDWRSERQLPATP